MKINKPLLNIRYHGIQEPDYQADSDWTEIVLDYGTEQIGISLSPDFKDIRIRCREGLIRVLPEAANNISITTSVLSEEKLARTFPEKMRWKPSDDEFIERR